ncbi:MAG: endonuclease MutS2 [Ruminococcaceae bacterium]|nr:endonuclease MutS2 [Oscillospiraceae bacterium]
MQRDYCALELDKILELLAAQTCCEDAAEMARALRPATHPTLIQRLVDETDDACRLMAGFGSPSFGGLTNVVNPLRRAEAGASLTLGELLRVAGTLRAIRTVREWRSHCEGVSTVLDDRFNALTPNKYLEEKIATVVVSEEEVADTASPALADIRRKMRAASARVREQLDRLVRSPAYQKALQEPIVTIRGDRFVVPVKAEHRGEVPGLVHDTSSSGATVFVEPMGVVEANNELKVLRAKEKAEIERILLELSAEAGGFATAIIGDYKLLLELNVIFAKGQLAYRMKAMKPRLTTDGHTVLRKARHPLIDPAKIVPIDVELGGAYDTLVITGPNTGGKTVTLKTLGLLTLMTMCGLLPPVSDGSQIAVFERVLVDIGDEQSIEQSLSTFSSHMVNVIRILKEADDRTLVLMDELGAGTDPVEGAALAVAILERLRGQGARIGATTHYAELKAYAIHTPGVENAGCEFDVASLRPTYRLLVGVPGRSNAFAITERLGMEASVVEHARGLVSGDDRRLEDVVTKLDARRQELEDKLTEAENARRRSERAAQAAEEKLQDIETRRQKEMEAARQQAQRIVEKARAEAQQLMDELDALRKEKEAAAFAQKAREAKSQLRSRLRQLEDAVDPVVETDTGTYELPRPLVAGDRVQLVDMGLQATVVTPPDGKGVVEVQAGAIRTRTTVDNLRLFESKRAEKKGRHVPVARPAGSTLPSRMERSATTDLDLRGQTVEEALLEVDRFLDNAVLCGLERVTVIHGKGTGTLRAAVHQHLKGHRQVKGFRLGVYGEGETGVTVVELK